MRKLLTVLAAIGVLSTMFVGAAVAHPDWTILITVGTGPTFNAPDNWNGTRLQMGTRANATDGRDIGLDGMPAFQDDPLFDKAKAAWYRPEFEVPFTPFAGRDFKAPLRPGEIKVWKDLLVWADTNYEPSTITVYFYTPDRSLFPDQIGGRPVRLSVNLTYAPAGYAGPTRWVFPDPVPGTGRDRLIGQVTLPVIPGVKTTNPVSGTGPLSATQVAGYRMDVVVPEPGSMLVLASGITGLMGLIARRRSA
jgi:hypothetical protein